MNNCLTCAHKEWADDLKQDLFCLWLENSKPGLPTWVKTKRGTLKEFIEGERPYVNCVAYTKE